MSGMGSTLQLNNPTVVAAFRSALIHQGVIALLIFFLLAMIWVSVREWVAGPRTSFGPAAGSYLPSRGAGRFSGSGSACCGCWTACSRRSPPCRWACPDVPGRPLTGHRLGPQPGGLAARGGLITRSARPPRRSGSRSGSGSG